MQPIQSLAELTAALRQFNTDRDWQQFHHAKNLAMCLAAEAGELLEPFMWLDPAASDKLSATQRQAVADEVGDVLICLCNLCDRLGIDPLVAASEKLIKNGQKYPSEMVRGRSTRSQD